MTPSFTIEVIEARREWAYALRSGEYEQANSTLVKLEYTRDEDGYYSGDGERTAFCCLGVLCQLRDPDNETYWVGEDMPQDYTLIELVGLTDVPDTHGTGDRDVDSQDFYARLNDKHGFNFDMIARVLEERVL